jgi:hypothetical protein
MKAHLLWDALRHGADAWLREAEAGDMCLCFDRLGLALAGEAGIEGHFVDDFFAWEDRIALEAEAAELTGMIAPLISDRPAAVTYDLRIALTEALRALDATTRAAGSRRPTAIRAQPGVPEAILLGAAAAFPDAAVQRSRHAASPPGSRVIPYANRAVGTAGRVLSPSKIRVLAFPGGKVGTALEALPRSELRAARVGVGTFPTLVAGGAARLVLSKRLPAIIVREHGEERQPAASAELSETASRLGSRLTAIAEDVVARTRGIVASAVAATRSLEACSDLRAVVIPSTSGAGASVLGAWARDRGVLCAVVQHGIYVFRSWDAGDRDADVVLAWGDAVPEQFAHVENGPLVHPVGTPGLTGTSPRRANGGVGRVLIATTNAPTGSALGLYGFCEAFVDAVAPFVGAWREAGADVRLRLHPSEDPARYELLFAGHGLRVEQARPGTFAQVAPQFDTVVSSLSSIAFEAAALGVDVALWTGGWPRDVRAAVALPPLNADLPALFSTAEDFARVAAGVTAASGAERDAMRSLSRELARYAQPLRLDELASQLRALGA